MNGERLSLRVEFQSVADNLISELHRFQFDSSHDEDHVENVLGYADRLHRIHGGDGKVILGAALLHDLGRSDTSLHGEASRDKSIELAVPILERNGFSEVEIARVCEVIADHDQPDQEPETIEGKILKDADFLDGFGERGIDRIITWTASHSAGTMEQALERLEVKMPQRIGSLTFEESREIARESYKIVDEFAMWVRSNRSQIVDLSSLEIPQVFEPLFSNPDFLNAFEELAKTLK